MDKFAFITGSSDRIGKAIAIELAKMGYNLILHYNQSHAKVEQLKSEIEQYQVKSEAIQLNFLEEYDFDSLFDNYKQRGIIIDLLVNCASDFIPSDYDNKGATLFQKEMTINFEKAYLLTKSFARTFEKGEIINFIDTKVEKNYTKHLDYLLSKKLLKEFTKLSAVHLAPNFRVNAIGPGLVLPPAGKDESYLLNLSKDIPLQTIGNMEDVIKAFRFLLESKFITGQVIYVDGGDHLI
ncbi:MAG: SDR family oxidoreductase [Crocinitomicaceae bacterium]|nr:SDR family oxidoreductase [Crocinitomicaceae bacterium]